MDESDNLSKSYVWGIDISGSEQGAGGVGGLLMASDGSVIHFPAYDGNGNITAYTDGSSALAASYEYSPFGALTASSGSTFSPFRFSTKCYNTLTGLYYYGFRYYSPRFARWINRDPIGERGGINLYAMVGNDAVNKWDKLGKYYWMKNARSDSVSSFWGSFSAKVDIAFYPEKEDGFCCEEIKLAQRARITIVSLKYKKGKLPEAKANGKLEPLDWVEVHTEHTKPDDVESEMDEDGWFDDTTNPDSLYYQDSFTWFGNWWNGNQSGKAMPPNEYEPAKLSDEPGMSNMSKKDMVKYSISYQFQTRAECTKGADKGKTYDTLEWGLTYHQHRIIHYTKDKK